MTNKNDAEKNAEETLLTLDQLNQTLEVMSHVVERLKSHLERQLSLTAELFEDDKKLRQAESKDHLLNSDRLKKETLIIEISQKELEDGSDKTTH